MSLLKLCTSVQEKILRSANYVMDGKYQEISFAHEKLI